MNWIDLPQEYKDLSDCFNKSKCNFNNESYSLDEDDALTDEPVPLTGKFFWLATPQGHNFWKKCHEAKSISELPKIKS